MSKAKTRRLAARRSRRVLDRAADAPTKISGRKIHRVGYGSGLKGRPFGRSA